MVPPGFVDQEDEMTAGWLQTTTCPTCGGPAEVTARHVLSSTAGPVEHARVQCVRRHTFNLPTSMLEQAVAGRRTNAPRTDDGAGHDAAPPRPAMTDVIFGS